MSTAVGLLNFTVGTVYLSVGLITLIEMRRNWSRMGFSHFGAAWVVMLFTCGPHYLVHGEHMLFHGQPGGALDLVAVTVALPTGVIWFAAAPRGVPGRPRRSLHPRDARLAGRRAGGGRHLRRGDDRPGLLPGRRRPHAPARCDLEPDPGRDLPGHRLLPRAHAAGQPAAARRLVALRPRPHRRVHRLRDDARRLRRLHADRPLPGRVAHRRGRLAGRTRGGSTSCGWCRRCSAAPTATGTPPGGWCPRPAPRKPAPAS